MKVLLDTHFLIWIVQDSKRLKVYPWLSGLMPWGVSPISLLELKFLAEVGRIELSHREFLEVLKSDQRFLLDDISLAALVEQALDLGWTRDPFDRLLVAHSLCRRLPLCSVDRMILQNHALVPRELR